MFGVGERMVINYTVSFLFSSGCQVCEVIKSTFLFGEAVAW